MTYRVTFLSPYISFKDNKVVVYTKTNIIFRSESGKIHKNKIKFDPEDGTKVEVFEEKTQETISIRNWDSIVESSSEENFDRNRMTTSDNDIPGIITLTPSGNDIKELYINMNEHSFFDLEEIDIKNIKKQFLLLYEKEINFIMNNFEDVKIGYGIFYYED